MQGLNWEALAGRKISAPFVPQIKDELDVSNFSEDFTSMAVADSPAVIPALNDSKIFKVFNLFTFCQTRNMRITVYKG